MFARDAVLVGGMGYVVPVGGLEITGVLLVFVSVLLQAVKKIEKQKTTRVFPERRKGAKKDPKSKLVLSVAFASLRLCARLVLIV